MYADFTSLIRAGRVLMCKKASSYDDIDNSGMPCSIFVVPLTIEAGDVVIIEDATFPYTPQGESAGKAPVVAGDWSPIIFTSCGKLYDTAGNVLTIGTDIELYYAPIEINER